MRCLQECLYQEELKAEKLASKSEPETLFALQDALEATFAGVGEATGGGGGGGGAGCHLVLTINDGVAVDEVLSRIKRVLADLRVATPAEITIDSQVFIYTPSGSSSA